MSVYAGDKLVSGGSFEETKHILDKNNPHEVTADQVKLNASSEVTIADEMDDLKKSVSDGKALVAGAITSKRVETASDASFAEMAANIDSIKLGSGNAQPNQVLSGATFSNSSGDELTGTMPNKTTGASATLTTTDSRPVWPHVSIADGSDNNAWLTTNSDGIKRFGIKVPEGYYNNSVVAIPATSLGNAVANQVLSGASFSSSNGFNISGSIPSKGAQTYTPGTGNQTISAGQYLSGAQTIAGDANLVAANIKKGTTIFGVTGSLDSVDTISKLTQGTVPVINRVTHQLKPGAATFSGIVGEVDLSSKLPFFMVMDIGGLGSATYISPILKKQIENVDISYWKNISAGTKYQYGGGNGTTSSYTLSYYFSSDFKHMYIYGEGEEWGFNSNLTVQCSSSFTVYYLS